MRISVIVPVFNEKEIIVIDDYSTDGTRQILKKIRDKEMKVIFHSHNKGKGAAIRTAQTYITGDVVIIQDADLEYEPKDYLNLVKPIEDDHADVVYGSRFIGAHKFSSFWHYFGNKFLTWTTNILYQSRITDMETCYKAFKSPIFLNLNIKAKRFDFEPEVTAKALKAHVRVIEVPVTYNARYRKEGGKKITWKDGLIALWTLIKYRFVD